MPRALLATLVWLAACHIDRIDDTSFPDDTSDTGETGDSDTDTGIDTTDTSDTDTGVDTDTADTQDTVDTDTSDTDTSDTDTGVDTDTGDTSDTAVDTDTGPLLGLSVELVASGLTRPVAMVSPPGDPRLFIVEQRGTIRVVQANGTVSGFVLDLRGGVDTGGSEQGLLGLAFHPDFATNHLAYVNYTDTLGDTVVAEYEVNGDAFDTSSKRTVLQVDQPFDNHNGGDVVFGPDGYLYIGFGDGGDAGDPGDRAQNNGVLLGKMLRIDPLGGDTADNDPSYGIPDDNPFIGQSAAVRKEIWAYGLRNPWRYSFDRQTGDLWIGDVGQDEWEEIDFQPHDSTGGENYGWNECEGTHKYPPPPQLNNCTLAGSTLPVQEYAHAFGCSVTGGYVYRGSAIAMLQGRYVYADYCEGMVKSFVLSGGVATDEQDHTLDLWDPPPALPNHAFGWISSFGEDADGELYMADHTAGKVWRIVPGP